MRDDLSTGTVTFLFTDVAGRTLVYDGASAEVAYLEKTRLCGGFGNGSDGTRTRDLRRDRPVRRDRLQPATTRNRRLQQAFRRFGNRL